MMNRGLVRSAMILLSSPFLILLSIGMTVCPPKWGVPLARIVALLTAGLLILGIWLVGASRSSYSQSTEKLALGIAVQIGELLMLTVLIWIGYRTIVANHI